MNYFLDDIADYLESQGITDVTVNYYQKDLPNQVCLLSTGGNLKADQSHSQVTWQILVTSTKTNRNLAQTKSRQILEILQNKYGKLVENPNAVHFFKILATSEPSFLSLTSNGLSEFTTLYSANIREPDLTTIYI
jgi:hypothetical protein